MLPRSLPCSVAPLPVLRFPALLDLEAVFAVVLNDYTSLHCTAHCGGTDEPSPDCGPVFGRTDRPTALLPSSSWSLSELSVRPNALLLLRVISCPCALERAAFLLYTKRGGDLPGLLHPFTFSVHLIYSIFGRASCPYKAGDDE